MSLPDGWVETTFGECQSRSTSIDPRKFPDEDFDLFSVPSYSEYKPEIQFGREIGSAKQAVQPDDVLICKIVPHIRRSWVVPPRSDRRQIASGEWILFRDHGLEPEFLRRFLLSDGFHEQFMRTTSGVGGSLTRARPAEAAGIKIPVPPLAEQRRIVAKLDALTARLTRARKELDRVPLLAERMRSEVVGYEIKRLLEAGGAHEARRLFTWSSGKFLPKKAQKGGNIPVYGGNGRNGWHDASIVNSPTLVIGRVGAQCGNVHLTPGPAWITDNAIFARDVSAGAVLDFAHYVFRHAELVQQAAGTGQPYVNQDVLNKVPFPIASVSEQSAASDRIKLALARADRLEAEAAKARALLDRMEAAILARAFRGELVPQDPADEPASILLDRIRAQRAAAPKPKRGRRKKAEA